MDDWNFSPTVLAGCMYGDVMNKDFGWKNWSIAVFMIEWMTPNDEFSWLDCMLCSVIRWSESSSVIDLLTRLSKISRFKSYTVFVFKASRLCGWIQTSAITKHGKSFNWKIWSYKIHIGKVKGDEKIQQGVIVMEFRQNATHVM
jgi:hypothetical protein